MLNVIFFIYIKKIITEYFVVPTLIIWRNINL